MKAMQMFNLLRFLPILIGDKVHEKDEYWSLITYLSLLNDLVFAPAVTPGSISFMESVIFDHLTMFKNLFGETVRLRPKQHLLVHLQNSVRKSGPLIGMSCLRYELKTTFLSAQQISCVTLSMYVRH